MPLPGDLARNPGMRPDWEANWQPLGSQAGAQSTEPHQPGPIESFKPVSVSGVKEKGVAEEMEKSHKIQERFIIVTLVLGSLTLVLPCH